MDKKLFASKIYMRITSYAPYEEMNGIPRHWFEEKIAEGLTEYAAEKDEEIKRLREALERIIKEKRPERLIDWDEWGIKILHIAKAALSNQKGGEG